ncbi:MAG: ATP-binding protein [Clostridia bacterium]|nr:ATP-binding protein [Clostridia bacterium]
MLDKLEFQIAFGAIKHFGRNLYTTNPPAIAELVANAWDAYATECSIYYNESDLLIIDNGIGMTDNEFQERYACSGYTKNLDIRIPKDFQKRPYMGKKGIGKFSAFSLADKYILYTKSDEDTQWKAIELQHDILNTPQPTVEIPIRRIDDLNEVEEKFNIKINFTTGTIIYLPNIKRSITEKTVASLNNLLPRRFSVTTIINDGKFSLKFQGKEFDLKKHFYYDNIELVYYFGYTKEEIKKLFTHASEDGIREFSAPTFDSKGWIATTTLPNDLKADEDTKIKGVVIYINGKLADEDIFKNFSNDMHANAYIIGEVNADFLDATNDDPVLSNREGLNHENEDVIKLREYLQKVRSFVLNAWGTFRASRPLEQQPYLQKALDSSGLKNVYSSLPSENRAKINKYAQKLFDRPKDSEEAETKTETLAQIILPAVFQIVNEEALKELLQKTGLTSDEVLQAFTEIFDFSEINHAIRMRANVTEKLKIIQKLKDYKESGEVEKIFEKHLAKNPWLIEPYWIAQPKTVKTQDYYTLCGIDNEKPDKKYIDIIIDVASEINPVIVEIKREKATSYSVPNCQEIIIQLLGYKKAIAEELKKQPDRASLRAADIKAYFVCGDVAMSKLSADDRQDLINNRIELKSYDILIRQAEAIFSAGFGLDEE